MLKMLTLLLFAISAQALMANELPIKKHLQDATKLNRDRAPLYAKLTALKSLPLSYELIAMENIALVATLKLDQRAKKYLKKGIGVFHDDLVDMKLTPKFIKTFPGNHSPEQRVRIPLNAYQEKWLKLLSENGYDDVYQDIVWLLEIGPAKETNQNCLTRHFLESIARSIFNLEGHRQKAAALDLEDPKKLLTAFIQLQIKSLSWAQSLDRRAFPIQQKNVPLFCQDVPAITYK